MSETGNAGSTRCSARAAVISVLRVTSVALAFVAVACTSGPPPPNDGPYVDQVLKERAEKDAFFKTPDGPLTPDARRTFTALPYFPVDAAYRVPARLVIETVDRATILELPQSHTEEKRKVRRLGVLHFSLPVAGEGEFTLTAFVEVDAPDAKRLFVPFTDMTSNKETYGGGRYLELKQTPTGLYDLDFNTAYHPYCVYNASYVCPLPPRENKLMTAIKAGERLPGTP